MATDTVTELMEQVLANAECTYLSDLHDVGHAATVHKAVLQIPADGFSAEAWTELANYVMHGTCAYKTGEQAASALLTYLADRTRAREEK